MIVCQAMESRGNRSVGYLFLRVFCGASFFLTPADIFPIFSKKQRAIMNIVLMCFVCFFLFSYAACFYLAAITFHIQNINLKKCFCLSCFCNALYFGAAPTNAGRVT
jgi:hypothetical protein